jgi:hypothetical protein
VCFSYMNRAIGQSNASDTLALPPAPASAGLAKAGELADAGPCGERLDFGNFAQNLKVHRRSVSKSYGSVNGAGTTATQMEGFPRSQGPGRQRDAAQDSS